MRLTSITIILLFFLLTSCKSTFQYTEIKPKEIAETTAENLEFSNDRFDQIEIKTAFVGYASDYMIYQLELHNRTTNEIYISQEDIEIQYEDGFTLNARNKDSFVDYLKKEKTTVKKQKKLKTAENILIGVLGIASIFSGGGNVADGAVYALESTVYVAEDNKNYKLVERSIEDEIIYIEDWVLDEEVIEAGDRLSTDIIFPIAPITESDFDIVIDLSGTKYTIPYSSIIREGKK